MRDIARAKTTFIQKKSCGACWGNTVAELQSEAEERPICGLQMVQPCCAQVRKSCWTWADRTGQRSQQLQEPPIHFTLANKGRRRCWIKAYEGSIIFF